MLGERLRSRLGCLDPYARLSTSEYSEWLSVGCPDGGSLWSAHGAGRLGGGASSAGDMVSSGGSGTGSEDELLASGGHEGSRGGAAAGAIGVALAVGARGPCAGARRL